ncbi:hypothetical protein M0R45_015769 [Rubus argutus]|uniref:Uncharacterized protein n=1 Tax=Rubus argutus TaxID=59490 RepID=A0AAW1XT08_RUBAR
MFRKEREVGSPSSGKHCSSEQLAILNSLRDVSCLNPLPSSFEILQMSSLVRVVGSSPSFGNESANPSKLTLKNRREVSVDRPHCIRFPMSFLQDQMRKDSNLDGNASSGNGSNFGQLDILMYLRDRRRVCISCGSDLSFEHLLISRVLKLTSETSSGEFDSCEIVWDSISTSSNSSLSSFGK